MAKTWSADNPKAALMARKRAVIVDAALKAFLDAGYAEASVNQIAATAGVSIKTLYRHFESKDDLFSAVMQAACGKMSGADIEGDEPPPA
jgi:AcrR family transcriptional regulator